MEEEGEVEEEEERRCRRCRWQHLRREVESGGWVGCLEPCQLPLPVHQHLHHLPGHLPGAEVLQGRDRPPRRHPPTLPAPRGFSL